MKMMKRKPLQACSLKHSIKKALDPSPFFGAKKIFFHIKLENIKFLYVNNKWDFSLFIEQDIIDKCKLSYHSYQ